MRALTTTSRRFARSDTQNNRAEKFLERPSMAATFFSVGGMIGKASEAVPENARRSGKIILNIAIVLSRISNC